MKIAYVIGRFQPFHNGHKALVDKALEIADRVVIIIGDTGCKPDYRNPWTIMERVEMISSVYPGQRERIDFVSVEDIPYDDHAWKLDVKSAVAPHTPMWSERFLVGHKKDASSFYLELFPEWQFVPVDQVSALSATDFRRSYFAPWAIIANVPESVRIRLAARENSQWWREISAEREAVVRHENDWDCEATRKYGGPVLAAVDALLYDDRNVLLIRRGRGVGKGALALPGGFVDPSERLLTAALRELREETGMVAPVERLGTAVKRPHVFDHPQRSMRGRIITNVFAIYAPGVIAKDAVPTPGDDAAEAMWVPRAELPSLKREFFSDHYHIIQSILKQEGQ